MSAFNLIDEKWIPCMMANGEARELNLRDVLTEACEVRGCQDNCVTFFHIGTRSPNRITN